MEGEKESIIDDVDFELELIQRYEINVAYILALFAKLVDEDEDFKLMSDSEKADTMESVLKMLESEVQLRSKRELIENLFASRCPKSAQGTRLRKASIHFFLA